MALMVDGSDAYATQAFKCKAVRKWAAYFGVAVETVKIDEVAKSPHGIRGWAEMAVTVPGINDKDDGKSTAEMPAGSAKAKAKGKGKAKPKAQPAADHGGHGGDPDVFGDAAPDAEPKDPPTTSGRKSGKRVKKEPSQVQQNENKSKEILAQLQRSQQIMDKIACHGDAIPSEWKWAKTFLNEFQSHLLTFKDALEKTEGEDLSEFADELRINMIDRSGMKAFKKKLGDRYGEMLTLFVDRCSSVAAQNLG